MKIAIEYIQFLQYEFKKINQTPLDQIEFFENGMKVEVDKKHLEEFEFIGLNNTEFILTGFYLKGMEPIKWKQDRSQ